MEFSDDFYGNYDENSSLYSSLLPYEPSPSERVYSWLVPTIFSVITLAGLAGNFVVIYTIYCHTKNRTVTSYYILNLALTDIAFLLCCAPFTASVYATPTWLFGRFMCKFVFYMMQVSAQATCITLTAMSVDRYQAIVYPLKSLRNRTPQIALLVSIGIWTCSALLAIPVAVYFDAVQNTNGEVTRCKEVWPNKMMFPGYAIYTFLLVYAIPLSIISVCYTIVLTRLWKQIQPCEETRSSAQTRFLNQKRRITRMVLAVIIAFAVCWLPLHVINLWQRLDEDFPQNELTLAMQTTAYCMAYANSCVNPFVYAFVGGRFRERVRKAFPALSSRKRSHTDALILENIGKHDEIHDEQRHSLITSNVTQREAV
ncbi:G-protein coupled receptor 54-like [Lytechinus variegatus]|uniref:G-protein coupled receptor 54-like n=3 Tax=Lytechinus TaxID=7652 RepID=UPI001BB0E239|nr:G-protein coupled receptor 54-like [Lytechinus variegatus]XP_054766921.1 G-protein coupled receptor 54-like [Lytechinus pictus]